MGVPKSHEMTAPLVTLFGSCLHLVVRKTNIRDSRFNVKRFLQEIPQQPGINKRTDHIYSNTFGRASGRTVAWAGGLRHDKQSRVGTAAGARAAATFSTAYERREREGNHRVSIIMFMHTPSSHGVVCVATALAPVAVLPPLWVSSRDPFAPAAELVYACKHIYTNSRVL